MGWTAWCDFLPTIDDEYRFTSLMWGVTLKTSIPFKFN